MPRLFPRHHDAGTDVAADDFLHQELAADLVFEVLPIHALLFRVLLQVFDGRQVVLLAHLIQPLDEVGFHVNILVFGLLDHQRLVDQVAQKVLAFIT